MAHIIDRLSALRVRDVMAHDVVTVSENQSMSEVACVLHENEISSAAVVDDRGHCVGVVTATDFVKRECVASFEPRLTKACGDRPHQITSSLEDSARDHMSGAIQSIDPGASLLKAARMMCDEHIHRLLVIDKTQHPAGVVSTMDIVAALVNVVNEMEGELDKTRN